MFDDFIDDDDYRDNDGGDFAAAASSFEASIRALILSISIRLYSALNEAI